MRYPSKAKTTMPAIINSISRSPRPNIQSSGLKSKATAFFPLLQMVK